MTKQEYIKQQYGPYWDTVKDYVDENGWFPDSILGEAIWPLSECERKVHTGNVYWRISTLTGVEDNNGWIKVEDRLPENNDLVIVLDGNDQYEAWYDPEYGYWSEDIHTTINPTHWRPKVKYPKPLY